VVALCTRFALSRARLITTIKVLNAIGTIMSAVAYCPDVFTEDTFPNHELFEIHRSKISLQRAKAGYNYPTIRLPHTFSKLVGLSTRIYQTVHEGALAFLVVISKGAAIESSADLSENAEIDTKMPVLTWQERGPPNANAMCVVSSSLSGPRLVLC
jgi:hypothetical protein